MRKLSGNEIRKMWLTFFQTKQHAIIPSAPLVPYEDPTLLWINAGIAPLKKYFDGREKPLNPRMVNVQKSIRTNDIDNVGRTPRHHTFFEMLGNFSIGDYFREEALTWACEILFSEEWFGFEKEKLYMTYYPTDYETRDLWIKLGIKPDHLIPLEGNFWEIGEGPCGPCTEIFYDRGTRFDPEKIGVRLLTDDIDNDRYTEIWNIVFSQFNAKPGLNRSEYPELPSKNIDTGMGLERMTCIIQGVNSNYETDLFYPLIQWLEKKTQRTYTDQMSFRVIADHIRSVTFALTDGATFSNESRGYVLRRILRRAMRFGKHLGLTEPFLYEMVPVVIDMMKEFYPNLSEKQTIVQKMIFNEEENFLKTLENGERKLFELLEKSPTQQLSGQDAFLLYDTFGFPLELTMEIAQERSYTVDTEGFEQALQEQKQRARASRQQEQSMNVQNEAYLSFAAPCEFVGYTKLSAVGTVTGVFSGGIRVKEASGEVVITTDVTPFYAESGGQIGDTGAISIEGHEYQVLDTFKLPQGQHAHVADLGINRVSEGMTVQLTVDRDRRLAIMRNHTATHLLNQSLRNHLGSHVVQQGSQVSDKTLRFDFNHYQNVSVEEILSIEKEVNQVIQKALPVEIKEMPMAEAIKLGAQALFGEKYGETVRVVDNQFSIELCGGTHAENTKDLKQFAILSLESKGSGIFRVEASTYPAIKEQITRVTKATTDNIAYLETKLDRIIKDARAEGIEIKKEPFPEFPTLLSYQDIINTQIKYQEASRIVKEAEKQFDRLYRQAKTSNFQQFLQNATYKDDKMVIIQKTEGLDINVVKDIVDKLAEKADRALVFFANVGEFGKIVFICKAKNVEYHAGNLVKLAAIHTQGNGGGRSDFAQAGGKDETRLDEALSLVKKEIGL
ncbi:MAG: alanine--tRNA ligase [Bacilli bacterium]|jgi:alanyl-tRNA synthetase|nr:alanine--tRNA ligase [Bacilli bacterium]HHU23497.1 alanine--tRNA ligase [Acholeplasmataceae bacterium]